MAKAPVAQLPKGCVSAMTDGSPSLLELHVWLPGNAAPVACLVDSSATHTFIAAEVVANHLASSIPGNSRNGGSGNGHPGNH